MRTIKDLNAQEIEKYRYFLRARIEKEEQSLKDRFDRAWEIARIAANMLYQDFCAQKVIVFGSLTDIGRFTKWSDIDIAVLGVPDQLFYKALGRIISLSSEFKVDLLDIEDCREDLKVAIEKEGISL